MTIQLILNMLLLILPCQLEVCKPEPPPKLHPLHQIFQDADIPSDLWEEYATVAACESWFDYEREGDGGLAQGLFQIHWYFWAPWAENLDNGKHGKFRNPYNPVENARLAYIIQERDSMSRGQDRWEQWSVKPQWGECQERARILMEDMDVFNQFEELQRIRESSKTTVRRWQDRESKGLYFCFLSLTQQEEDTEWTMWLQRRRALWGIHKRGAISLIDALWE